jgi:hypothetical protein
MIKIAPKRFCRAFEKCPYSCLVAGHRYDVIVSPERRLQTNGSSQQTYFGDVCGIADIGTPLLFSARQSKKLPDLPRHAEASCEIRC